MEPNTVGIERITIILVSAIIGLLGLMISKENKVSEFRQKWIDDLRAEISSVVAHAYSIRGFSIVVSANENNHDDKITREKVINDHFLGFRQAVTSIRLRLTKSNDNDEKFLTDLDKLVESLETVFEIIENNKNKKEDAPLSKNSPEYTAFNRHEEALRESSNVLLKSEWERVKNGEPLFNFVSNILAATFVSLLVFFFSESTNVAIATWIFIFICFWTRKFWLQCVKRISIKLIPAWLKHIKCPFENID